MIRTITCPGLKLKKVNEVEFILIVKPIHNDENTVTISLLLVDNILNHYEIEMEDCATLTSLTPKDFTVNVHNLAKEVAKGDQEMAQILANLVIDSLPFELELEEVNNNEVSDYLEIRIKLSLSDKLETGATIKKSKVEWAFA